MKATIVIAPDADDLQRFAAAELDDYLQKLFGITATITADTPDPSHPCFLVGPITAPHIRQASSHLPELSDQGILIRRLDDRTLLLAGGSTAATAWAVHLNLGGNSEPLFPVLERVLWPGAGISTSMGYTASRAVRAMRAMESLDTAKIPAALIVTLQDDNVGSLPQVATRNLHLLTQEMVRLDWRGFLTRHWPVGDLDPPAAYLARFPWHSSVTPESAYEFHFPRAYGHAAAPELSRAMSLLEDATLILDLDFLSLFFPVLGIMCRALEADSPMPEGLFHVRALYEEARRTLDRLESQVSTAGRPELAYWQSRLEFAVQALVEKELVHEGGMQIHTARQAVDEESRKHHLTKAEALYNRAIAAGEAALRATAAQLRDDSDRATLAAYYHFFVREVKQRAAQLLTGAEGISAHSDPM